MTPNLGQPSVVDGAPANSKRRSAVGSSSQSTIKEIPPQHARGRGGGPNTAKGKQRSSRNAIRHGVFSQTPVIGDEREEDWLDHRDGIRESLAPQGRNEEIIVGRLALNLWQRLREERWFTETLQHQVQELDRQDRFKLDNGLPELPEEEAVWEGHEASEGLIVAYQLKEGDSGSGVPPISLATWLFAFDKAFEIPHPRNWVPEPGDQAIPDFDITVGDVMDGVDQVAKALGRPRCFILSGVEVELYNALARQLERAEHDLRIKAAMRIDSVILTKEDFAGHERRVLFLDKEYDRLLQRLELAQRARGGALPPPIRVSLSGE